MMASFGKIAYAVRCGRSVNSWFMQVWTNFLTSGAKRPGDIVLAPSAGLPHHIAAQALAAEFLNSNADSVLFIDDDITFTPSMIDKIRDDAEHKQYHVLMGVCIKRGDPYTPVCKQTIMKDGQQMWYNDSNLEPDSVKDCAATGLGFTLIRREAFKVVLDDLQDGELMFQWGPTGESEDVFFTRRVAEAGFKVGVTTKVKPGHIMDMEASYQGRETHWSGQPMGLKYLTRSEKQKA